MMETKEICQKLNQFFDELNWGGKHCVNLSLFSDAADRLEQQEVKIEELHDFSEMQKEEISILKKQLSEKQPEWISVEDERKPKHLQQCFIAYCFGDNDLHFFGEAMYIVNEGNGIVNGAHFNNEGVSGMRVTHWMEIPKLPEPPKPKEPSFKDFFLKAFPKASSVCFKDYCPKSIFESIKCPLPNFCAEDDIKSAGSSLILKLRKRSKK